MRWKYASVGTEAVFPLTSTLIISKLALFPASKGDALSRAIWFVLAPGLRHSLTMRN
jgi:hypothetical protein